MGNSYHDNSGVSLLTEIECYGERYFPKSFEHSCWLLILGPIEEEFFFLVINLEITYFYLLVTDFNLIICHSALKLFFA